MKTSNIRGFPGYHVTKHGKVYRKGSGKWSLLPIKKWGNNYVVNLTNSYKRRTFIVARLVAMTYIPNPENKPCVCHKDNNPLNNHVDNLYWGTQAENMSQMRLDKRDYRKVSIRAHRRVIRLKSLGWSSSRIGKRFKVNRTCINRILNKYEALLK